MATTTSTPATITTWKLDPAHSHAEFKVKHMMISNVKGSFSGLSGTLTEHATDKTLSTAMKVSDFIEFAAMPSVTRT